MEALRAIARKIILLPSKNASISTKAMVNIQLEPIQMSFESYENTKVLTRKQPPPLIIMHGLLGSKTNWKWFSNIVHKETKPQRKIISVDARNHGESPHTDKHTYPHMAEDIKAFMAQMKIKKAVLLGHSMGGRTMMYFALKYSTVVDKLIIVDVSPVNRSDNKVIKLGSLLQNIQKIPLPKNVSTILARKIVNSQLTKFISDTSLRSLILTNLVQTGNGGYAWRINLSAIVKNFLEHLVNFPDVTNLKYEGPTLFISGEKSNYLLDSDHSEIKILFPKVEYVVIPGAGHWIHRDKPEKFTKACLKFLNNIS